MIKIIDIYAEWCQPCKTLSPILDEVVKELDIKLEKINIVLQNAHIKLMVVKDLLLKN